MKKSVFFGSLVITSSLLLTGCSSQGSIPNDKEQKPVINVEVTEGEKTVVSFTSILNDSISKLKSEGIIEEISYTGGYTVINLYDPKISDTVAVSYNKEYGVKTAGAIYLEDSGFMSVLPQIETFIKEMSTSDLDNSSNSEGTYIFKPTSSGTVQGKFVVTTNGNFITGYEMFDFNDKSVMKSVIQYGNFSEENKVVLEKFAKTTPEPASSPVPLEDSPQAR